MREVSAQQISESIALMCKKANTELPPDIYSALKSAQEQEDWPRAAGTLCFLCQNADTAIKTGLPICQDTGMACVFIKLGQDVHITGGSLEGAVNLGVRKGYEDGLLRKSVVADPLRRKNTGDNTPAIIHTEICDGEDIEISFIPKGFGSENMSAVKMLTPADGEDGVIDFVIDTVRQAGSNPCPPVVVGVGIGGSFDYAPLLAKKALLRPLDVPNADEYYASLEQKLLEKINKLGIGPAGYGGKTCALGVSIEAFATHIAGLPVAVNISCHATRRLRICL